MKVPSLVDFYNNQNRLAVEAASQTASNQTNANMNDKRIQAEQQLQRFTQMMENMRQQRSISSQQGLEMAKIMADDARAKLGRDFQQSENSAQRQFDAELAKMKMAGETQQQNLQSQTAKDVANIQVAGRAPTASETAEQTARARLIGAQADAVTNPDVQDTIQTMIQLAGQRKNLAEGSLPFLKNENRYKTMMTALEGKLKAAGIDPNNVPELVESRKGEVKKQAETLAKTLDSDFQKLQVMGAKQKVAEYVALYQYKLTSDPTFDPVAGKKKLLAYAQSLGVNPKEVGI